MKTITFTDVEAAHVRRAVASLAGTDADGEHLRTALVKLDRGNNQRLVVITLLVSGVIPREVFRGLSSRWTAKHLAFVSAARKRGAVTVTVGGAVVDPIDLGVNEAFS